MSRHDATATCSIRLDTSDGELVTRLLGFESQSFVGDDEPRTLVELITRYIGREHGHGVKITYSLPKRSTARDGAAAAVAGLYAELKRLGIDERRVDDLIISADTSNAQ